MEILSPPEIINLHKLDSCNSYDKIGILYDDLNIDTLLSSVPFISETTLKFAKGIIRELNTDKDSAEYKLEIFQDLLYTDLRNDIRSDVERLNGLHRELKDFRGAYSHEFSSGIKALRSYKELIDRTPDLSGANSEALEEINSHFSQIKASKDFGELCKFLGGIDNLEKVNFSLYLDENGAPARLSTFKLVEKKPAEKPRLPSYLQKLSGDEEEEQSDEPDEEGINLVDEYGHLSRLGEEMERYMEKQFISVVKSYIEQVEEVTKLLEPLDFYVGFAEYFTRLKGNGFDVCRPTLLPMEERRTTVKNARNPLLMDAENNGDIIVPNDISSTPDENMFIITGPNNGGKTTYVKTAGLIQLMAQNGLFVPAESAEVSIVDGIYTHFVSADDVTKKEGRYLNELSRMKKILLERATPYSLAILDEPTGGTNYEEGQRESLVLLDSFHRLGTTTYFTTHMHTLTEEVEGGARYPAAKNLHAECIDDGKKITYTYKIKPGASGKSYGEEIARDIGLTPENILEVTSKRAAEGGYTELLRV